jgi:cell division protein pelota
MRHAELADAVARQLGEAGGGRGPPRCWQGILGCNRRSAVRLSVDRRRRLIDVLPERAEDLYFVYLLVDRGSVVRAGP